MSELRVTQPVERLEGSAASVAQDALDPRFAYGFGLSYNDMYTLGIRCHLRQFADRSTEMKSGTQRPDDTMTRIATATARANTQNSHGQRHDS